MSDYNYAYLRTETGKFIEVSFDKRGDMLIHKRMRYGTNGNVNESTIIARIPKAKSGIYMSRNNLQLIYRREPVDASRIEIIIPEEEEVKD